jgi:hypothetical protein
MAYETSELLMTGRIISAKEALGWGAGGLARRRLGISRKAQARMEDEALEGLPEFLARGELIRSARKQHSANSV